MKSEPYIPAATIAELNGHHAPGTRHDTAIKIALPLIGNGMDSGAVFDILRGKFESDVTDAELRGVVNWCLDKNPQPSGYGPRTAPAARQSLPKPTTAPTDPPKAAREKMAWWLNGQTTDACAVMVASPRPVPANRAEMPMALFRALYGEGERINVVRAHFIADKDKACPQGAGMAQTADEWQAWIAANNLPESDAGAWMRFNPTNKKGSGKDGAFTDADIAAFRFMLIESDVLPLNDQLAFYLRSKLPIVAIIQSGGDSAHAWVRLDAADEQAYAEAVGRVLTALESFGFDRANKNPSRLCRMPGAKRKIGAVGDGIQRLLFLNPEATALSDDDLAAFEVRLRLPLISERPFLSIFNDSVVRYDEMVKNRGKLGVPTGITDFDEVSGGLKPKQLVVIAAPTGGGKTTVALNIISHVAWQNNMGVALFTMEMDREEVCDILVSINCEIDRNFFNNGNFSEHDLGKLVGAGERFAKLPLYVFDEAVMTTEKIRERVQQLRSENLIRLVVVDYLQFITAGEAFRDNREQQVATISRALKQIAKDLKVPVIALSQLNDDGKIRESRVIAHDSHIVLHVEEIEGEDCKFLNLSVQKGRHIPKNQYMMKYIPKFAKLTPVKVTHQPPPQDARQGHPNSRKR